MQFLVDTLELWRVEATVEAAGAPCVAVVQVDKRAIAWIERAAVTDMTFRWIVRFAVDSLSDPTKARAPMHFTRRAVECIAERAESGAR